MDKIVSSFSLSEVKLNFYGSIFSNLTYFSGFKYMKMPKLKIAFFLLSISGFISCQLHEQESPKAVPAKDIFFDYKIWGEEGKDAVTCLLQFRFRREAGRTVKLDSGVRVEVDGELIQPDSARITGPFFEIQKPIDDFTGSHTITFIDLNKKEYTEEFIFRPFSLLTEIPDTIYRDDLIFDIEGLQPVDYLRIIAIDTLFKSEDINEIDTVKNGKLIILKEKLKKLVNGPVTLWLNKEEERPVKNGTERGGKISIMYGLKREFVLAGGW
jgi:hypothetical protein